MKFTMKNAKNESVLARKIHHISLPWSTLAAFVTIVPGTSGDAVESNWN